MRLSNKKYHFPPNHYGFTLIEVLIALVILSIGLLGLAGLQATSLRNNQGSLIRSQAAILAYDMADRVRANTNGIYHLVVPSATAGCKNTTGCTSVQMAQNDVFEWNAAIAAALPGGQGVICLDSTPNDGTNVAAHACDNVGNLFVTKLWWDDDRNPTTPNLLFASSFQR